MRRRTRQARIECNGKCVTVGGDAPVRIQSMTNTDTEDADATARQVASLARAGSEAVRITVNTLEAARQVPAGCSEPTFRGDSPSSPMACGP